MKLPWFRKDEETDALALIHQGTQKFSQELQKEDAQWRELYANLKTDLLDEFLSPGKGRIKEAHIRILKEQVRHVLSVAHVIGDKEMIKRFREEEQLIDNMRDLIQQYPNVNVETSADLRASLEKLRRMLREHQKLVFDHEEILQEERKHLVEILEQVKQLRNAKNRSEHAITSFTTARDEDRSAQTSFS